MTAIKTWRGLDMIDASEGLTTVLDWSLELHDTENLFNQLQFFERFMSMKEGEGHSKFTQVNVGKLTAFRARTGDRHW